MLKDGDTFRLFTVGRLTRFDKRFRPRFIHHNWWFVVLPKTEIGSFIWLKLTYVRPGFALNYPLD